MSKLRADEKSENRNCLKGFCPAFGFLLHKENLFWQKTLSKATAIYSEMH